MASSRSPSLENLLSNLRLDVPAWTPTGKQTKKKRRSNKVCRFFVPGKAGSCRFGNKCRFVHKSESRKRTSHRKKNISHEGSGGELEPEISKRYPAPTPISNFVNKPPSVASPIEPFIIGTCMDMCPGAERLQRKLEGNISTVELEHAMRPGFKLKDLMIKQYTRSSAGESAFQACTVRPPSVLLATARYLCTHVLDLDQDGQNDPRWQDDPRKPYNTPCLVGDLEVFITNRFRMIEKDLAVQGYSASGYKVSHDAIRCFEIAVRYHVLMSYACRDAPISDFDPCLNWKLLGNYASSLHNLYLLAHRICDSETARTWCCNEDRMRSYIFLSRLPLAATGFTEAGNIAKSMQTMLMHVTASCASVLNGSRVQAAISIVDAICNNDYNTFFSTLRDESADHLFLCAMYTQVASMRVRALSAVNRAYRGKFSTRTLVSLLGCRSGSEAMNVCISVGLNTRFENGCSDDHSVHSIDGGTHEREVVLNHRERIYVRKQHQDLVKLAQIPAVDRFVQEYRRASLVVGSCFDDMLDCKNVCVEFQRDHSAFIFKQDRALDRQGKRKKRSNHSFEVWCCFEPSILAERYGIEDERGALQVEKMLLSRVPSVLAQCRLTQSVLDASGIRNAAIVMLCETDAYANAAVERIRKVGSGDTVVTLPLSDLLVASQNIPKDRPSWAEDVCRQSVTSFDPGRLAIGYHLTNVLQSMLVKISDLCADTGTAQLLVVAAQRKCTSLGASVETQLRCPCSTRSLGESSWMSAARCLNNLFRANIVSQEMHNVVASETQGNIIYYTCRIPNLNGLE